MFDLVTVDQLPPLPSSKGGRAPSVPVMPLEDLQPGQAFRLSVAGRAPDTIRRIHSTLRTRAHKASRKTGLNFVTRKVGDEIFVIRSADQE